MVTAIVKLCSAMRECKQQPDPLDISDLRIALAGLPDSPFPVGTPFAFIKRLSTRQAINVYINTAILLSKGSAALEVK